MNSFYIRKSTKSPNALESQNKELTELAGQLIEEDTSEQFLKMLANAKEGDSIHVVDFDRISSDPTTLRNIITEMQLKNITLYEGENKIDFNSYLSKNNL